MRKVLIRLGQLAVVLGALGSWGFAQVTACSTLYGGGVNTSTNPVSAAPIFSISATTGARISNIFTPGYATAAIARHPTNNRIYFIENTAGTTAARLGYFDLSTSTLNSAAATINKGTDSGNFTRLGFNANGVGYASIGSTVNSVYTITPSANTATITRIGTMTGLPTNVSGDFAVTAANRAWLSADGDIYRIDLNKANLPATQIYNSSFANVNGVVFDTNGDLLIADLAQLYRINLGTLAVSTASSQFGTANSSSADLANCINPALDSNLAVVKSVSPTGAVVPGAVLTYTIVVTNNGTAVSVNTTFQDSIPANTTYVANSTTFNGSAFADVNNAMPFTTATPIKSPATSFGSGIVGTGTANGITITFQVRVNNPFPSTATSVTNQGFVEYDSGSSDTRINVPSTPPGGGTGGTPTTVGGRDFGDAPDAATGTAVGNYQTTASDEGPSHTISATLKLGSATTDADAGTLQNAAATADDTNATDDEDGLTTVPTVSSLAGQATTVPVTVSNTTGANAFLTGFLDFNKDGDFLDAGEKSATLTVANNATTANLSFTTPAGTTGGATYLRLRLSSTAVEIDTAVGAASSGEVEDYGVTLGAPDLTIAKSHTPASFTVGSTGTYSFTVTNGGGASSSGQITVTDTLPAGLTFVPGTPGGTDGANWSCSANAASPQTVTCTSSAALPAAGTSTFTFGVNVTTGAAPGTNSLSNTAAVVGGGDTTSSSSNTDTATVLSPNLTISKSHTPATFVRGSTGTYTITVGNTGTAPTGGTVTVTDTLPAGLTVAAGTFTPTGTNGAAWSCTASGQTVTCTSTTAIATSGSSVFSFSVAVGASTALPSVTNNVTVSGGNEATANTGNNSASDVTPTSGTPDLTLTKSHTGTFTRGGTGVYTLRVDNIGNLATSGTITVTDTLPAGLTYVSSSGTGWSCSAAGQTVTCTSSTAIPVSGSSTFTLTVNVALNAAATVVNNATVAGGGEAAVNNGNNSANNGAGDPTSTIGAADLTLAKSHTPASFTVGSTGTYSFTVTNSGESPTVGTITVTDTLPTGLTYAGPVTGAGWTCSASGQTVTCTSTTVISSTAGSNTSTFSFPVNVTAATAVGTNSVTNTATVSGGGDTNAANNTATDPTTILSPNLTISKTHTPATFVRGSTGTYTITVGNTGTAPTSGTVTVVDTLPVGLTVAAGTFTPTGTNGSAWSCSASGQTVTCTSTTAIATSGSSVFSFSVAVGTSIALPSVTNNVAVSGGNEATALNTNNAASDVTPTATSTDLTISKTASGTFVRGSTGSYTLTVSNGGETATSGTVTVSDTLPAGLSYRAATGTGWSCSVSGQTVTCTRTVAVPAGGSAPPITLTVNVLGTAPASAVNTATVSGGGDVTPDNNSSTATTPILSAGSLSLAKTVENLTSGTAASSVGNSGQPGDTLEYCIAYSNPDQSQVTGAEITDDIPDFTVATTAVADYGGLAIRWRVTAPTASTQNLTAEADADAGTLSSLLSVTIGTVPPGGAGDVCFRVSVD